MSGFMSSVGSRYVLMSTLLLVAAIVAGCGSPARRAPPIADVRIDLDGQCSQTEDDGYREEARLLVRGNQVQALDWNVRVAGGGSCRFAMQDFRQTRTRPHIELAQRSGSACRLIVWQEPRGVTLAHTNCAEHCTPRGIDDKAWPVTFDARSGRCSRNL